MQIFIKLNEGNCFTYTTISDNDTVIMMKRFIRKKINMPHKHDIYSLFLTYAGKQLYDHLKISDILTHNATVHMFCKVTCGPTNKTFETENVYFSEKTDPIQVTYSPNDSIRYIIQQVLEILVDENYLSNGALSSDYYLMLGNQYISSDNLVAEYPELSSSFILFNKQDRIFDVLTRLDIAMDPHGSYYQMIPIGERKKSYEKLQFCIGKHPIENINNNCVACSNNYNIIMPCCRKKICYGCFEYELGTGRCPSCQNPN